MADRISLFLDAAIAHRCRAETQAPPPADCVRQFPTLNPETVELVGFDSRSVPQIRVEIPRDEDVGEWSRWLLRWTRRRERERTRAGMHLI